MDPEHHLANKPKPRHEVETNQRLSLYKSVDILDFTFLESQVTISHIHGFIMEKCSTIGLQTLFRAALTFYPPISYAPNRLAVKRVKRPVKIHSV